MRKFLKRLWSILVLKAPPVGAVDPDADPMPMAKQLLLACKGCPPARVHVKEAMRAIFDFQMEAYDNEQAD